MGVEVDGADQVQGELGMRPSHLALADLVHEPQRFRKENSRGTLTEVDPNTGLGEATAVVIRQPCHPVTSCRDGRPY